MWADVSSAVPEISVWFLSSSTVSVRPSSTDSSSRFERSTPSSSRTSPPASFVPSFAAVTAMSAAPVHADTPGFSSPRTQTAQSPAVIVLPEYSTM